MCRVTVLIGGSKFVQDTNSCAADISGSFSITLCGVEAPDSAGVSLECPRCSLPHKEGLPCDLAEQPTCQGAHKM